MSTINAHLTALYNQQDAALNILHNIERQIDDCHKQLDETFNEDNIINNPNDFQQQIIDVEDKRTSRTFKLRCNSHNMRVKYPKIHPVTGERLYLKQWYWKKVNNDMLNDYFVDEYGYKKTEASSKFIDTEYVDYNMTIHNCNSICYYVYDILYGWAMQGYVWMSLMGKNAVVHTVEVPYDDLTLSYIELCNKYT